MKNVQNKEVKELDWSLYCNILYHLQEGYYGTALTICDEELHKANESHQLILFRSIAMIKYGQYVEVIRLLHQHHHDTIIEFAASIILRTAHSLLKNPDREEISELDQIINEAFINASDDARYNAAIACMLLDNNDKAYSIIEKTINSSNIQCIVLKAWIELNRGKDINIAQKLFKKGITAGLFVYIFLQSIYLLQNLKIQKFSFFFFAYFIFKKYREIC
ncbi:unnamed protein product [Brugia pahangi]|uniref:Coatomer subunit epsilon n=1 Tax=Brugia pahangi TaxID=6280 RepID=A0A0N4T994_BRUPA|nr:unnamed protein product [Brugia pahangi]